MSTTVTGEQFIRATRNYLEAHEHKLLSSQPNFCSIKDNATMVTEPESIKEDDGNALMKAFTSLWTRPNKTENRRSSSQTSASSRPTSLAASIPYMSLLAAASPNATSLSNTPYMPIRSNLPLDIHHLYFLLVQFEYLGLEETLLPVPEENGLVETETTQTAGTAPSIASSINSVMSTLSLSTGWQLWSKPNQQERPLHEDIVYIHKYFTKINALKLNMNLDTHNGVTRSGQRTVRGYEKPLDGSLALPLLPFKELAYLELNHIPPHYIDHWSTLSNQLVSLVIKDGQVDNAVDVIGDRTWPKLKMLSLADNSLTTLESQSVEHIRSLTHLNVSSNLLIDVPSALSILYNLTSLNLSYNMISSITGINTVLGNIQELDLRGNRLTMLAGLDRLFALERLDVRDNRIEDAAEIGRLTSLPNIYDVWVEGNPFTKLQPEYRVDIFSMFRNNDGGIELDGSKPSYLEKRRILTDPHFKTNSTPLATVQPRPANEEVVHKVKTKTKPNKRVFRFGQNSIDPPNFATIAEPSKHVHRLAELENSVQQEVSANARRAPSVRSKRSKAPPLSEENAKSDGKLRKKIEAIKKEAGTEWLRVLQEMDVVTKENLNK
ncbi:hypothetical protein CU098_004169 [Rhizopus stolonifer]|uniref:Uncharacterized protein n=1 Tax=Rhizopus stolonifer TaxID=4846 RepID=A0A367IZU7_RHIST|nr:hypothetical protein CU098_004169 [Rhizopus stolonifer]